MAAKQWFFMGSDGIEYGPLTGAELRDQVLWDRVGRETLVRTDSSGNKWVQASLVKGLFNDWEIETEQAPSAASTRRRGLVRAQAAAPNNPLAIASLVSGILGWTVVPVVGAAVAIVTGHIALKQIEKSDGREDGKLMATIGLILGYIEAAILFVGAMTLAIVGISFLGAVAAFFQIPRNAPNAGPTVQQQAPPGVQKPNANRPFPSLVPNPRVHPFVHPFDDAKLREQLAGPAKGVDAEVAKQRDVPGPRIAAVPQDSSKKPPSELTGSWDVTGPRLQAAYSIEFAPDGRVIVRHEFGRSFISPWSYRDGEINFGGMIQVNTIKVQGPWNARGSGADRIDVVDPDGQELTLKRRSR